MDIGKTFSSIKNAWNSLGSQLGVISPTQANLNKLNGLAPLASSGIDLNVTTKPNGTIEVRPNKEIPKGKYALSGKFYEFLTTNSFPGIINMPDPKSYSGKIIGFSATDEKAFNALLDKYAQSQNITSDRFAASVGHRVSDIAVSKGPAGSATPIFERKVEVREKEQARRSLGETGRPVKRENMLRTEKNLEQPAPRQASLQQNEHMKNLLRIQMPEQDKEIKRLKNSIEEGRKVIESFKQQKKAEEASSNDPSRIGDLNQKISSAEIDVEDAEQRLQRFESERKITQQEFDALS